MSTAWLAAVAAAIAVLERENAALAAMDLRAAAALEPEKARVVQALTALRPAAPSERRHPAALRLDVLAQENRAWLERGLAAQGRVIGLIASAAQAARRARGGEANRYTARGGHSAPSGQGIAHGIALSARA